MRRSVTLPLETTWAFYRGATSNPLFGMFQIVAIVALLFAVTPAAADASAAWDALRKGGYVALMRHGDAPGGAGDPAGFKLDDAPLRGISAREGARRQSLWAHRSGRKAYPSRESSARHGAAALKRQN